jgi:hypothetical protein
MISAKAAASELAAGHAATRKAVSECLDVEAGLREVLLASEHDATRADVTAELQAESGLAAIMNRDAAHETGPAFIIQGHDQVAEVVQELPAADRLELRKHPSFPSSAAAVLSLSSRALAAELGNLVILPYVRDIDRVLTAARDRAWHGDLDRGADLDRALTYARALGVALARILQQARDFAAGLPAGEERAFAQEIAVEIDSTRERTVTFVRKITLARDAVAGASDWLVSQELLDELVDQAKNCDPVRARSLAEELDQNLTSAIDQAISRNPEDWDEEEDGDDGGSRSPADPFRKLTEALHKTPASARPDAVIWLRETLDNVRGADLRNADFTGVPLDGLRWSSSTQWPDELVEKIKALSVPLPGEEGVFVVRDVGSTTSLA